MAKRVVNASPLVASSGLPAWATCTMDSLLGSGVITADEIEDLGTPQLVVLAGLFVRTVAAGERFDAPSAITEVRTRYADRYREREAA